MSVDSSHPDASSTYGLSPFGFKGFCLGFVGSYGQASGVAAGAGEPDHHSEIYTRHKS